MMSMFCVDNIYIWLRYDAKMSAIVFGVGHFDTVAGLPSTHAHAVTAGGNRVLRSHSASPCVVATGSCKKLQPKRD